MVIVRRDLTQGGLDCEPLESSRCERRRAGYERMHQSRASLRVLQPLVASKGSQDRVGDWPVSVAAPLASCDQVGRPPLQPCPLIRIKFSRRINREKRDCLLPHRGARIVSGRVDSGGPRYARAKVRCWLEVPNDRVTETLHIIGHAARGIGV